MPKVEGGDDPEKRNESNICESEVEPPEGQGDGEELHEDADHIFFLLGSLLGSFGGLVEMTTQAEVANDGEAEQSEGEPIDYQRRGVDRDRKRIELLFDQVVGEEGEERKAEEEAEIGPENEGVDALEPVDHVMVIDPVDAGEGEGQEIDGNVGGMVTKPGIPSAWGTLNSSTRTVMMTAITPSEKASSHDGDGCDAMGEGG